MTQAGLDISDEVAIYNMRRIPRRGWRGKCLCDDDMEDYTHCGKTLEIFKLLKAEYNHIGTVIQSYLYRTEKDMEELNALSPNLRLVKGAYKESLKSRSRIKQTSIKICEND